MADDHASDDSDSTKNPALKDTLFDAGRFRTVAREAARLAPRFDANKFLAFSLDGLDRLSLMQRLRRMTEALRATLPQDFRKALGILKKLAPRTGPGFAALVWPDFVAQYGHGRGDFEVSMDALKFFTTFGSSEFAVREFLRRDLRRTLAVMEAWSRDGDEAVRRLASEGCRPRLPWSFRLEALVADPSPVAPILENLRSDPSLYVRKSVGNHLNDITKDHPEWVLRRIAGWPLEDPHTAWIVKRALRTLIKKGDRQALAVVGAGEKPRVRISGFLVEPPSVRLGGRVAFSFRLESAARKAQRLVVDYAVHYVKKGGGTSAKVFKLKEFTLAAGAAAEIAKSQSIQNFTTRTHHPGRHVIDVLVNGERLAGGWFDLLR
ncbi:DNA alkylation repair protein [Termitidicoccus mucosus]|uniref:DNA alkylation repair protein n=1 Tax=Termitidicoccus mucosus TaxID=1184151 RepID=A0A178IN98_9BACT|nr:DNA alkylation repair protein [Opitutaceae bacterium TSB47]